MTSLGRSGLSLAVSLSVLAGYVDAIGYLSLKGYFVSFMSGNSTLVGVDMFRHGPRLPLLLILGFVAGVMAGSLLGHWAGTRHRPVVLAFVSSLLAVAACCHQAQLEAAAITCMVLAMGAENTVFEEEGSVRFGLTYVTGSLVRMAQGITSALQGGKRWEWIPYFLLWAGLIGGAIAGALSHARFGLSALWWASALAWILTAMAMTPVQDRRR